MTTAQWAAPADVGDVVARIRELDAGLAPGDGVGVFNRVYLSVTEEVGRRLAAGTFADGPGAAELAVRFAGRYLAAVEGGAPAAPASWRPLLQLRAHPGIRPLQFAIAGISAHVGHDLALAVVDTCRATAREPSAIAADYDEVGGVLTAIEERVREELMPGPDLLERFDPLTHLMGSWSLARARDGAWTAARALWQLRDRPEAYGSCADGLDTAVGLLSRTLLTPLPD
jgi:Family of unknown function (DUF5995)